MSNNISIVIINYNSGKVLPDCIASMPAKVELLVVDNASMDGSADLVTRGYSSIPVIKSKQNLGFAGGVNLGFARTSGDIVVVLNPDVVMRPGCLEALVSAMTADENIGVAGCKLLYPDGKTIQHAGGILEFPLALTNHYGYREIDSGQYNIQQDVDYVTGAAMAIRRNVWAELGGFDESFFPAYFEETDFCVRVRKAGYRVTYVPGAEAVHLESATIVRESPSYYGFFHQNRLRFILKHYDGRQLLTEFFPAEMRRLNSLNSNAEQNALLQAYLACRANLAQIVIYSGDVQAKKRYESDIAAILGILSERAAAIVEPSSAETTNDVATVTRLQNKWEVAEKPFLSNSSFTGRLIVKFREAWNWMSTKWYVRPIVQQQNEFNYLVAKAVQELEIQVQAAAFSGMENDRENVNLAKDLARIELRLKRIEDLLQQLNEKKD